MSDHKRKQPAEKPPVEKMVVMKQGSGSPMFHRRYLKTGLIIIIVVIAGTLIGLKLYEDSPGVALTKAQKSSGNNDFSQTIKNLSKIDDKKLNPTQKQQYYSLEGQAYQNTSNYKDAIKIYEASLAVNPNNISLDLMVAQLASQLGDHSTAATYYQKTIVLLSAVPKNKQGIGYSDDLNSLKQNLQQEQQLE